MTGDMKKKLKNCFFKKCQFLHFFAESESEKLFFEKTAFQYFNHICGHI